MKVSYEWLQEYGGEALPAAARIEELLTFHSFEIDGVEEAQGDTVFDVKILPNRGSDCLSHRGIARELSSIIAAPLAYDPLATVPNLPATDDIAVTIENQNDCPRFTAALIEGVEVAESPAWLKKRLEAVGQRSINNIVDATNYVMLALGQPLHAYDADLFPQSEGKWQFLVRRATAGETIALLPEGGKTDDRIVELSGSELLIVDGSSGTPIGLAGVKGGRFAGVHAGTTRIIIEAAHFHPTLTRQTARRLGIVIDASKRFENEPSRELPLYAQQDVAKLITDIAGGALVGVYDTYLEAKRPPAVTVRAARANALLGLNVDKQLMIDIVQRLGATVTETDEGFIATGPFERTDLLLEEDYIEEIGRLHGLEHIQAVVPTAVPLAEYNARHYYSEQVREVLLQQGFSEIITSSFRKKDTIQLQNALASDKSCLRSTLVKNIDEALALNIPHVDLLGLRDVRVFEIGTVFAQKDGDVTEHVALALGVRTKVSGYTPKDDEKLRAAIAALELVLGAASFTVEKGIAECNFSDAIAALPVPTVYDPAPPPGATQYKPFSNYPSVTRDVALWVGDNTPAAEVELTLNTAAGPLRVRTTLFDEFQKDGRTSYAFRLVFQSNEKTLTDGEVNALVEQVHLAAAGRGWAVR